MMPLNRLKKIESFIDLQIIGMFSDARFFELKHIDKFFRL